MTSSGDLLDLASLLHVQDNSNSYNSVHTVIESQLEKLRIENQKLSKENDELKNWIEQIGKPSEDRVSLLESECEAYKTTLNLQQEQIKEMKVELKMLRVEMKELSKDKAELTELNKNNIELNRTLSTVQEEFSHIKYQEVQHERNKWKIKYDTLDNLYKKETQTVIDLGEQINTFEQEVDTLKKENKKLKLEKKTLLTLVNELENDISEIHNEYEQTVKDISNQLAKSKDETTAGIIIPQTPRLSTPGRRMKKTIEINVENPSQFLEDLFKTTPKNSYIGKHVEQKSFGFDSDDTKVEPIGFEFPYKTKEIEDLKKRLQEKEKDVVKYKELCDKYEKELSAISESETAPLVSRKKLHDVPPDTTCGCLGGNWW